MKNIWTIMSKEFARFFGDRRLVIMTLMPAILIYIIYSFMGSIMESVFAPDEDHTPLIYSVNSPESFSELTRSSAITIIPVSSIQAENIRKSISERDGSADILIIFPPDFDAQVEVYDAAAATVPAPNVEIFYNSTSPNSNQLYHVLTTLLNNYESSLANKFDINRDVSNADLATPEDHSATFISTLMPMLLMIFLFSGSMGLALESITGEKERGTLATLLVSPLRRSQLAIGKILSLAALSFLSGIATTFATILSLPNLMGGSGVIDAGIYSITDYLLLAFVILSVLLLIVTLLSIVSAFAKTVKEAGQATTPLMILVMVVGISGMFGNAPSSPIYYVIPLYGSVQSMNGIFSLNYDMINILVACFSSLICATLGSFMLTKMFNSEKVMFSR